jgi:DNA-binding response OmpR family regulator
MQRILLIDDDEFILSTLTAFLVNAGFSVSTTTDGPQGIALYTRVKPAAVILDLGLPSMDGLQVLKQIRERDAHARVVVLTGYPSKAAANAAHAMGAAESLSKPVEPELLLATLATVLGNPP